MDFSLSEEQQLIIKTTRAFVENELYPHEAEIERTGHLRPELIAELVPDESNRTLLLTGVGLKRPDAG